MWAASEKKNEEQCPHLLKKWDGAWRRARVRSSDMSSAWGVINRLAADNCFSENSERKRRFSTICRKYEANLILCVWDDRCNPSNYQALIFHWLRKVKINLTTVRSKNDESWVPHIFMLSLAFSIVYSMRHHSRVFGHIASLFRHPPPLWNLLQQDKRKLTAESLKTTVRGKKMPE